MKPKKVYRSIVVALFCLVAFYISASACWVFPYDFRGSPNNRYQGWTQEWENEQLKDAFTWRQGYFPYRGKGQVNPDAGDYRAIDQVNKPLGEGYNFANDGCGWYALSYMIYKAGLLDRNKTAEDDFIPYKLYNAIYVNNKITNDHTPDFARMPEIFAALGITRGVKQHIPEMEGMGHPSQNDQGLACSLEGYSYERCIAQFKSWYDRGLFVIILVRNIQGKGHFIFLDGFASNGEMLIGDSAKPCKYLRDYYTYRDTNDSFCYMQAGSAKNWEDADQFRFHMAMVYEIDGLKSCDLPSIYRDEKSIYEVEEANVGGAGEGVMLDGSGVHADVLAAKKAGILTSEGDLVGLTSVKMDLGSIVYIPPSDSGLSLSEYQVKNMIENTIKDNSVEAKIVNISSTVTMWIGLILIIYSFLLIAAGLVEYSGILGSVSIVNLLTLGRFKLRGFKDKDTVIGKGKVIGPVGYLLFVFIILTIGLLLLTGIVANLISNVIMKY